MRVLRYLYPIVLFFFAWSVCVAMYSLIEEETATLLGYPREYYMVPLLSINILTVLITLHYYSRCHGQIALVLIWLILIVLIYPIVSTFKAREVIEITLWPTSYLASYSLIRSKPNYLKALRWLFLIIYILGLFYFVTGKILQEGLSSHGLESASNAVFCVLTVMPFLLLFRSKPIVLISLVVTLVAVVFSNKRSALLIYAAALIPTIWSYLSKGKSSFKKIVVSLLIIGALVLLFNYLVSNYLEGRIFERFESISDDQGSGRFTAWSLLLSKIFSSDPFSFILGHGHYAVSKTTDLTAAHNDFLEVLYDYGLLLFVVYLLLHLRVLQRTIALYKNKSPLFTSYFFSAVVFIVMSWVSILIVQQRYMIYFAIYWGMVEALMDREIDYRDLI